MIEQNPKTNLLFFTLWATLCNEKKKQGYLINLAHIIDKNVNLLSVFNWEKLHADIPFVNFFSGLPFFGLFLFFFSSFFGLGWGAGCEKN